MTRYEIPVLARVGLASWARFKAECADLHDRLAVELQTDYPAHMVQELPDLNPSSIRQEILAAKEEYTAHLEGMLATLDALKGQPPPEQTVAVTTIPALSPDDEEEEGDDHDPTADDDNDNDAGEDEIPDPPNPHLTASMFPAQKP